MKSRFMKLAHSHIEYVIDCLQKHTGKIRNIKAYLLTALYNSSLTIGSSAGLLQEALAEKAGISPNTVSRIEGGLTEMYVETFRKLAHALGADVGDLLCKKE